MTEISMGYTTAARAKGARKLAITGNRKLGATLGSWLSLSAFAKVKKLTPEKRGWQRSREQGETPATAPP